MIFWSKIFSLYKVYFLSIFTYGNKLALLFRYFNRYILINFPFQVKGLIKINTELEKKIKLLTEEKKQSTEELEKQKCVINEKEEQVVYLRTRLDAFEEATAGTLTSDSSSEETLMKKIEMLRNANIKLVKDLEEERKNRSELQEVTTKLAQVSFFCFRFFWINLYFLLYFCVSLPTVHM